MTLNQVAMLSEDAVRSLSFSTVSSLDQNKQDAIKHTLEEDKSEALSNKKYRISLINSLTCFIIIIIQIIY